MGPYRAQETPTARLAPESASTVPQTTPQEADPAAPVGAENPQLSRKGVWAENLTGAAWMMVSGLMATAIAVSVKSLSGALDTAMIAFLRCLLGLWVLAPMALDGSLRALRMTRPWLHLLRGGLMGAALVSGFYALSKLELTTATLLFFLAPVFATALAGPILGERVGPLRWGAVAAGMLGAALILRPGSAPVDLGTLAALACAGCYSVSLMLSRIIARDDGPRAVLISSTAVAALVCLPVALPVWSLPGETGVWGWMALLVLASSMRMYSDIQAYAKGEAGFVAPFSYLRLIFVGLAGWLMFGETPDGFEVAGGAVIAAAGAFIAYRERALGRSVSGGAI